MKTLNAMLITTFSLNICLAQESTLSDQTLFNSLVGTWEHISSTYPGGDVMTYERKIQFFSDGKGTCTKFMGTDTLILDFQWEVKEQVVHLFVMSKFGKKISADAQHVSLVNSNKMYLTDAYGEDQVGKVCCYSRSNAETIKY